MNDSLETAFGRGFSLHIFPFDHVRWGAVELSTLEAKLSYTQDFIELPGISRIQHRIAKSRSIRRFQADEVICVGCGGPRGE